jgi:hypothetical protein
MSSARLGLGGGVRSLFFKVDPFSEVGRPFCILLTVNRNADLPPVQPVRDLEAFRTSNIYMSFVFSGLVCAYSIYAFVMYAHRATTAPCARVCPHRRAWRTGAVRVGTR